MTISLRSVLVLAPVLGVNSWSSLDFNNAISNLAQECVKCLEKDGSHGDACAKIGCNEYEPPKPANGTIATLTSFLGTSPLAKSSLESAAHHFECFNNDGDDDGDNDGDECSVEDERENNMQTIKRSLKLWDDLTDDEYREIVNAGASYRVALRPSVPDDEMEASADEMEASDDEMEAQPPIIANFDRWIEHINNTEEQEVAIDDKFEPLTLEDFKDFLSVLYTFDFETRDPTVAETLQMMRGIDGFLDAVHSLYFEQEKGNDGDGDNETLNGKEKDVLMEIATRHTFLTKREIQKQIAQN